MSVLEQGVTALSIDTITIADRHVTFSFALIGGSYDGSRKDDRMEATGRKAGTKNTAQLCSSTGSPSFVLKSSAALCWFMPSSTKPELPK